MKLSALLSVFISITCTSATFPLYVNKKGISGYHDVETAARVARTLVNRESLANVATIQQDGSDIPVSFVEYYADCDNDGEPILLMVDMSTTNKNLLAGSKTSISIRVGDHQLRDNVSPEYIGGRTYSVAGSPRVNLKGSFVPINGSISIDRCFAKRHPESPIWFPGSPVHSSHWTKFKIDEIYMVGGFGDSAYIGRIPVDTYLDAEIIDVDVNESPSLYLKIWELASEVIESSYSDMKDEGLELGAFKFVKNEEEDETYSWQYQDQETDEATNQEVRARFANKNKDAGNVLVN
ncbi:hypothetical protein CANARDRAFT_17824 [[Candida] arabinofermentans NRRL YB-2248]|uniref:CREG-like beta-barrel domain-containing protein n=1 Tax=[Candida] arabinofermentans NRRL YB-2248 TaxID=983967 RepID=A0A1E4T0J5_9ASCO|nr:hypothetical protein CANARDRAFT_17824 [[Candida] arabinofermentans NRRL YB-2248]